MVAGFLFWWSYASPIVNIVNQLEKSALVFQVSSRSVRAFGAAEDLRIHGFPGVCAGALRSLSRLQKRASFEVE